MRPLWLVLALALPVGAADIAQEYAEAKALRDRLAAEVERQARIMREGSDARTRAQAGLAAEKAQQRLEQAQGSLDAVVRKMKPGDAIWVQETEIRVTGGASGSDRYDPKVPSVGEGVPVDPRTMTPPPLAPAPPPRGVTYGMTPGFDNAKIPELQAQAPGVPPVLGGRRDPRKTRAPAAPAPEPAPEPAGPLVPDEGVPFAGPLPEEVTRVGFVVFPDDETFPSLMRFEARQPGAGSLKVLARAGAALRRADFSGAWKDASLLAERHPDDPGVRRLAAILALRLGRLDEADAHIRASLRLDPSKADAWTVLSWVRLRQGRRAEAAEAARWALRLDPAQAAAAAALKASGAGPQPAAGPVTPPALGPVSPSPQPAAAAPEPQAPASAGWPPLVLGVAAVSGAALALALKGVVWARKP